MKKKFLKLSLVTLITGIVFLIIAFLTFHFVTDEGITLIWHAEAGKPYVTELIGDFAILNLVVSFVSWIVSLVFYSEKVDKNIGE